MIGNTILFINYDWSKTPSVKRGEQTGLVVDAFTEVSGTISGRSETFLGFGEGSTHGNTNSKRKYKVEYFEQWDTKKECPKYVDIHPWQMIKIISYANNFKQQEINEEKIVSK